MRLPALASKMLLRLYDLRSLVLNAFSSIGSVLSAKIVVEIIPAMTGRSMSIVFSFVNRGLLYRSRRQGYALENTDSCPQWGIATGYFESPLMPRDRRPLVEQAQFPSFIRGFSAIADP